MYIALYNTELLTHQFETVQCFNNSFNRPWLSDCQSSAEEVYYSSVSQLTRGKHEYFV